MTKKITKTVSVDLYIDEESRYYDTQDITINNIHYCAYCGKQLRTFEEYDHYERYIYRNCDCEDANKEHELKLIINSLNQKLPKANYRPLTQIVLSKI